MLTKVLALFFCVGAISYAAAQATRPAAKPAAPQKSGAAQKPGAARERTPAEQARDEWNRGAVAYRSGRFAEAQQHFERVRQLDPKFKDVRLYIARSIAQQYRPGVEEPENAAKGEQAVAAYEALLADEPANDDAFKSLVGLLTQMRSPERVREVVLRRANDASLPAAKRVAAVMSLATAELKCSQEVTQRKENREVVAATEQGAKPTVKYKMPADGGDFYRAQQCATNGLAYVEHALQVAPDDVTALSQRAGFLRELSRLAEMEGNTGQKEFYDSQHAQTAERLKAFGVQTEPANPPATPPDPADGAGKSADAEAGLPVGVPECDQYLAVFESCVKEKIPESMRATLLNSINQSRRSWRQTATTPQARDNLARTCGTMREQARQAFAGYGCVF
jgi:tetratricopeptide (TPR) repeat protein